MEEPSLFPNILLSHKPIAVKLRRFNKEDQSFINKEIQKLLSKGIIEESVSSWGAQLVVAKDPTNHKKKNVRRLLSNNKPIDRTGSLTPSKNW